MIDSTHLAHGLAGDETTPDWPALTAAEVATVLARYPQLGQPMRIDWHSPRPLSAAALVAVGDDSVFIKRHHCSVRTVATLSEEHRFMTHLRGNGLPVPKVLRDVDGHSGIALGDWTYEVHAPAAGIDIYRETISWEPPSECGHARTAGRVLAELHDAAESYNATQRNTHILVARSELICAADPVAALQAQLPQRPGLADYLIKRDWQTELRQLITPWHATLQPRLVTQPRLWTHGDWHVSNLCWSNARNDARLTDILDFGLCAANFALFDLATAIERNAIAWLELDRGDAAVHLDIARALINGYAEIRPLDSATLELLANLLPLVHVDFAVSEVEYFHAITHSTTNADVAWEAFLCGHAAWFHSPSGQRLLQAIRSTG